MKALRTIHLLFFLGVFAQSWGQHESLSYDPDMAFLHARDLAFEGRHREAQDTLKRILTDYPKYTDVENLLAKTYSWDGEYDQARRHFNRITSRNRDLEEVWVASVKNEVYAGNRSLAIGLANKGLMYLGSSIALSKLRNDLMAENTAENLEKESEGEEGKTVRNFITLSNAVEAFDQVFEPMVYTSLEYQRNTGIGKIIPRLSYAYRFQTQGLQYELDMYPVVSKTFYGYLNYGFSNASIFPNHRAGAEVYANIPKANEVSLGMRYLDFRQSQATLLTGSFGMYRGNYYLSLRPYVTLFKDRNPGFSGSLLARKYLSNSNHFIGLRGSYGFNPELRQLRAGTELLAESLLFVETQDLQLEYQLASKEGNHRYRAELGVARQEFLLQPDSFYWVFRAGIRYQMGF
jgi:YaiO family outer membrane protein